MLAKQTEAAAGFATLNEKVLSLEARLSQPAPSHSMQSPTHTFSPSTIPRVGAPNSGSSCTTHSGMVARAAPASSSSAVSSLSGATWFPTSAAASSSSAPSSSSSHPQTMIDLTASLSRSLSESESSQSQLSRSSSSSTASRKRPRQLYTNDGSVAAQIAGKLETASTAKKKSVKNRGDDPADLKQNQHVNQELLFHVNAIKNKNSGQAVINQTKQEEGLLTTIVRMHFRLHAPAADQKRRPLNGAEKTRQEEAWKTWDADYQQKYTAQVKDLWNFSMPFRSKDNAVLT